MIGRWFGRVFLLGLMGLALGTVTTAQTATPWVNFYTGSFGLRWTRGAAPINGQATEFRIKCGVSSGQYTIVKSYPISTVSVPYKDVLPNPGSWYCTNTASDGSIESTAAPEIFFVAGAPIAAPDRMTLNP